MMLPTSTPRLRFRRYRIDDAAIVAEMFADPQARRFYPNMADPDGHTNWIRWNLDNYAADGFGLWVIEHAETGLFLGDCGLTYQSVEGQRLLEVGYHLQAQHRGHGYATEAVKVCIAYAFDDLGASLVCSIVDPANTASLAVASRLHPSQRTFADDAGRLRRLYWSVRT